MDSLFNVLTTTTAGLWFSIAIASIVIFLWVINTIAFRWLHTGRKYQRKLENELFEVATASAKKTYGSNPNYNSEHDPVIQSLLGVVTPTVGNSLPRIEYSTNAHEVTITIRYNV